MQIGFIIIGIVLIIILWTAIEQKQLVVTKYKVTSKKLPKAFQDTRLVILADLHNYSFGRENERLLRKIEEQKPDYILIAGDMINKKVVSYPSNAFYLLEKLAKNYRIYYAYGNHEQRMEKLLRESLVKTFDVKQKKAANLAALCSTWVQYKKLLKDIGVTFLDNEATYLQRDHQKVKITGVSIGKEFFVKGKLPNMAKSYLNELLGEANTLDFQILLAHNPLYFQNYADWGSDLTISGHLHGGLVRLPGIGGVVSPQVRFFPKYNAGNFTNNGQEMVVSRGLGSHSMMPRLFNIPEIVLITMKCGEL